MRLRAITPVVLIGLVASLAGCARDDPNPVSPSALLGRDLVYADKILPKDASNSVQDIGQLFDAVERFDGEQWATDRYVVVAACSDHADLRQATKVQLGVVSADALTVAEVRKARDGAYKKDIGCTKEYFR